MGYPMTASVFVVAGIFFYLVHLLKNATKVIKQQNDYIRLLERTIRRMTSDELCDIIIEEENHE
jgi:hypothetical protein